MMNLIRCTPDIISEFFLLYNNENFYEYICKFVLILKLLIKVLPAITVTTWFVAMYNVMGFDEVCWFGYYEHKLYWIIQGLSKNLCLNIWLNKIIYSFLCCPGPILLALIVNVFCLFNVIRILTIKLRESTSNDSINQIK